MCFSLIGFLWWKRINTIDDNGLTAYKTISEQLTDLELAWRNLPMLAVLADSEGKVIIASHQTGRMLQLSLSDIEGQSVDNLHPNPKRHKQLRETIKINQVKERPVKMTRQNGSEIEMELGFTSVRGSQGKNFIAVGKEIKK
jgi:PAS domain S-box-containing protein